MIDTKKFDKFVGRMLVYCIDEMQEMANPKPISIIHKARDNIDYNSRRLNCIIDEESIITGFSLG